MSGKPYIPFNIDNSENCFSNDSRIFFDEVLHQYTLDNGACLTPVSAVISHFFKPFDCEYWSAKKARDRNVEQGLVKEEWDVKGHAASEVGTHMHAQIENFFLKREQEMRYDFSYRGQYLQVDEEFDISYEMAQFRRFLDSVELNPFRVEWRVFDEAQGVAGTIDLVCRNGECFDIYDWKRSAKLPDTNRWQRGWKGLEHLEDTSYNHYCLQQNLYRYILEHNYGLRIGNMHLVAFHPDLASFKLMRVPRMDKEIEHMLMHRND